MSFHHLNASLNLQISETGFIIGTASVNGVQTFQTVIGGEVKLSP